MDIFKNAAIIKEIVNDTTVSALIIGSENEKVLTASKFYILGLREFIDGDEPIIVNYNPETNRIVEEGAGE